MQLLLHNIFSSNRPVSPEAGPRAEGLEIVFLYIMPIASIYHFTVMYSKICSMQVSNETLLIGEIIHMSYFHFYILIRQLERFQDPYIFFVFY